MYSVIRGLTFLMNIEKRKLDNATEEETKKRGLELEMKSFIGSHSSLSSWLRSLAILCSKN